MSRIRRLGFATIVMAAMLVGGAPAFAAEPLTTSGHVTDPDGFLSDDERARLESDAKSLRSTYGAIIDAVVVPNFSDREPSVWRQDTLKKSGTAEKGILYVVSYEDDTTRIAIIYVIAGGLLILTLFLKLRAKLREQEQDDGHDTKSADLTPLVDPVRREALRVATEARRRLSEAEEQVRTAEEDWNFARAHSVRASRLRAHVAYTDPRQTT